MFEEYAARIVDAQPNPPRIFEQARLWNLIFRRFDLFVIMFGFFWIISGIWAVLRPDVDTLGKYVSVIICCGGGVLLMSAPFVYALRWGTALHRGRLAYARIVYLKARPASSRVTYDAQRNGYASGEWEVYLPDGSFTARFALDQP
jgi:hypothetical protein